MSINFSFTRAPSTKVGVDIETAGLVAANNTLVLIGHMAATGSSATANVPYTVNNYGDEVAAATECDTEFGSGSEIGKMVLAAIKAVKYSDLDNLVQPPIVVIPIANGDDSSNLAATLAANQQLPIPFSAIPYAPSDATALSSYKAHLLLVSGQDRGSNGQFGSFGTMASLDTLTNVQTQGASAASQYIMIPWLRDAGAANAVYEVAAAYAAMCAACQVPFLPLNGNIIGKLLQPAARSDWHTAGDTGTEALGLAAGVVPLLCDNSGNVKISRTITSYGPTPGTPAASYYDMQDWQTLYYVRENAWVLCQQTRYKRTRMTEAVLKNLRSEIVAQLKTLEGLGMLQYIDKLSSQFTINSVAGDRFAAVYNFPLNVVPGFHNKGIGIEGTDQFDTFQL